MTLKEKLVEEIPELEISPVEADEEPGIYVEVSADWNDGDWITETSLVDIDKNTPPEDIKKILEGVFDEEDSEYLPSGKPDNAEYHTVVIDEVYLIDDDGAKYHLYL